MGLSSNVTSALIKRGDLDTDRHRENAVCTQRQTLRSRCCEPRNANGRQQTSRSWGSKAFHTAPWRNRPCPHLELTQASSLQAARFKFCCGSPSLWPFVTTALEPNMGGLQEVGEGRRVERNSCSISFRAHGVSAYLSLPSPFKHPTPCTVLPTSPPPRHPHPPPDPGLNRGSRQHSRPVGRAARRRED